MPENLVITWPADQPSDRPSAPQAYQCLLSHFLATLGVQEKADCTSMLSSIDSCQNRVSTDQYHLTVSRSQVSTHQGRVCFEVIRWQFTRFQMIAGSRLLFLNSYQICCVCQYRPALLRFWFQTGLRRKNSASFFKMQAGRLSLTMVTCWSRSTSKFYALIGSNLTGEFMRKIYPASWRLFTLTAQADRVLSELVMFLTVFFHWL